MVSESFDLAIVDPTMARSSKNTYQMKKNLFWTLLSLILVIFIVLLVLTIYFGVKQNRSMNNLDSTNLSTTTKQPFDLTTPMALPVERIPTNLKQEVYRLTIAPNITAETFSGLY